MMSLTFGLFTQVSGSGPLGPLVSELIRKIALPIFCILVSHMTAISKTSPSQRHNCTIGHINGDT